MHLTIQKQVNYSAGSLRDSVKSTIKKHLETIDKKDVRDLYDILLGEIEEPLLQVIMKYTNQNQSKAAVFLGLSRGTLRKKLEHYGMLITNSHN